MHASFRSVSPRTLLGLTALLASVLLAACQMVSGVMGPGTFEAKLNGAQLDEVVSVYLVVGDEADFSDMNDPRTIDKLVRPERQAKYVSFTQLKPALGEGWRFQVKAANPTHKSVVVKPGKKGPDATLSIDRELLAARPTLAMAVLVNCGTKGWGTSAKISRAEIENIETLQFEIRGTAVNRVGGK